MNIRWGFEEDDEWDGPNADEPTTEIDEPLIGHDRDGIVTVAVTDAAEVVSVSLARNWKDSVDPRALHTHVLAAINAATMRALAKQVEQIDMSGQSSAGTGTPPSTSERRGEKTPSNGRCSTYRSTRPGPATFDIPKSKASCLTR